MILIYNFHTLFFIESFNNFYGLKKNNVLFSSNIRLNIDKIPSIVVDTHVTRISNLLKFVNIVDAVKIEKKLSLIVEKNKLLHLKYQKT